MSRKEDDISLIPVESPSKKRGTELAELSQIERKRICCPANDEKISGEDNDSSSESEESTLHDNFSEDDQGLRVEHIDAEECAFLYQVTTM